MKDATKTLALSHLHQFAGLWHLQGERLRFISRFKPSQLCRLALVSQLLLASLCFGQEYSNKKTSKAVENQQQKNAFIRLESGHSLVNGLNIYYEIYGEGTPVVLIHGGGSTIESTFGRVIPILAAGHKVVAIELQTHGRTADRDQELSFEQDADDVAGLLKNLNIKKASIFGFSNGGTTALQFAIRHPQLVEKLIVASAIYKKAGAPPQLWDFIKNGTFDSMPQELKDAFLAVNPSNEALLTMFKRDQSRMSNFKDIADTDIGSISAKALILSGDMDVATLEHTIEMHRQIRGSSLMVIPGGHGDYIGEVTTLKQGNGIYSDIIPLIERFLKEK